MGMYTPPKMQDLNDLPDIQGEPLFSSLPPRRPGPGSMSEARLDKRPENVLHIAALEYQALYDVFVVCYNHRQALPPEVATCVDAADRVFW